MDFFLSYIALAEIYVLLGLSTNLLVGIAGIFSVSQAAVFGVGAYIVAYCLMHDVMGFLPAVAIAAVVCVSLNILTTLPSLRVSGDYFVVTSFGIQLLATAIFINWNEGTGGANGLPGIPPPDLFGIAIDSSHGLTALCTVGTGLGCLAFWLVMRAPFGRLLRAIREDELAVAAAGDARAHELGGHHGRVALAIVHAQVVDPVGVDVAGEHDGVGMRRSAQNRAMAMRSWVAPGHWSIE